MRILRPNNSRFWLKWMKLAALLPLMQAGGCTTQLEDFVNAVLIPAFGEAALTATLTAALEIIARLLS